ncbi:MAG: hypothetical protein ACFFFB_23780 [Candidatus Heimdallarchaeota archaeon]
MVLFGFGAVLIPGMGILLAENTLPNDFNPIEEDKQGLPKKEDPPPGKEDPPPGKEEPVIATVDIHPYKLNSKSRGKWITAYIELPSEYDVSEIDISGILLNDLIQAEIWPHNVGDIDNDDIPDLMIKFNRMAVISCVEGAITITGDLDDGTKFEGNCVLESIHC